MIGEPYNLLVPCGIRPPMQISMRPEEMDALDLLVHVINPDLVVETGTWHGGSSWIFSTHCQVISVDHHPIMDVDVFRDRHVAFRNLQSPDELDQLAPTLYGRRWLFFHDSFHTRSVALAEIKWARRNGAVAAAWHDVAFQQPGYPEEEHMLTLMDSLRELGLCPRRMQHFGFERTTMAMPQPDQWGGIGFVWL